jgi:glycosyltransferase involved in cell wall biosynthesis
LTSATLPRLLFVTPAAFNRTTGGGITFGNLFAGWPKDRLATAHSDPVPVTTETCERYYRLGPRELRHWGPLERIAAATSAAGNATPRGRRFPGLRAARIALFGQQLPDAGTLTSELERWIAEFQPELMYTILGSNGMMDLALAVQRRFGVPSVVHLMDDWPQAVHRGALLAPLARRRMQRLLAEALAGASLRIGICEAMSEAYAVRYGTPFQTFHNAVDVKRWDHIGKSGGAATDVVYVGSILEVAQLESLIDCCHAVARLEGVRLSIYSPHAERWRERLAVSEAIRLSDTIADDEAFFRRIAAADVLLLPVNFDARTVRYIRYSMPTKLPAYLYSGTPILAYGPEEVAQVRYVKDTASGMVVGTRGIERLADSLRTLLSEPLMRAEIGARARKVALERHDLRVVRPRFQEALARVAR